MAFNVVYSDKDRIQGAIESGVIPRESLVLTSDDAKRSEMYYYDDNGQLKTITKKTQFNSMPEARYWVARYDYRGILISVFQNNKWTPYIIGPQQSFIPVISEKVSYDEINGGKP